MEWCSQGTLYTQEGYGIVCAVVNQLFRLDNFITVHIYFLLYQKPILQWVDNSTYGTIAFPCMKSFLGGLAFPLATHEVWGLKLILHMVNVKYRQRTDCTGSHVEGFVELWDYRSLEEKSWTLEVYVSPVSTVFHTAVTVINVAQIFQRLFSVLKVFSSLLCD